MKFLIFSDSHGSSYSMTRLLTKMAPTLSGVIHLGDGTEEFRALMSRPEHARLMAIEVCGNGEGWHMASSLRPPLMRILEAEGVRVLLTHGHLQNVSFGTDRLAALARENDCTVALHGHTHIPRHIIDYGPRGEDRGVEILCPGSIAQPRAGGISYGILDLNKGQVLCYAQEVEAK